MIISLFFTYSLFGQTHGSPGGGAEVVIAKMVGDCHRLESKLESLEAKFVKKHKKKINKYSDFTELLELISLQLDMEKFVTHKFEVDSDKNIIDVCGCNYKDILPILLKDYLDEDKQKECPDVFKERTPNIKLLSKIIDEEQRR